MGLRIMNNVEALSAHRTLQNTNMQVSKSIERLSSGLRINRAADDAAGLAVSEIMRSQIRGMNVASRNAQDGVSTFTLTPVEAAGESNEASSFSIQDKPLLTKLKVMREGGLESKLNIAIGDTAHSVAIKYISHDHHHH